MFTIELNERLYMVKAPTHEEAKTWVDGLKTRQGSMVDLDSIVPTPVVASTASSDATETGFPNLNVKSWTTPPTEQTNECTACAECCSIQ